jgi:hypothetical protein
MSRLQEYAKLQEEKRSNKLVIPLVKEYLLGQWQNDKDRNPNVVHASEMAKKDWCERATWYRIHNRPEPEEKFNFVMQTIFDEGHQIHDKWQQWLRGTGQLWGDWYCYRCGNTYKNQLEPPVSNGECTGDDNYIEEHHFGYKEVALKWGPIEGHEDGAVGDRLIEFKSVGLGTLRAEAPDLLAKFYHKSLKLYDMDGIWKAMDRPLRSHVRQANIYLWMAAQMWGPKRFPKASIVYEFKPNQQSREYVIPLSLDIVEPLIKRTMGIMAATPLECPYGGCKKCKAYELQDGNGVQPGDERGEESGTAHTASAGKRLTLATRRRDGTE